MPVEVTLNWETEGYGNDRAEQSFHVSGVSNAAQAAAANGPPYGPVPKLNSAHQQNALLKAEEPFARRVGFGMWEVLVRWSIPPGGGDHPAPGGNPLLEPIQVEWTQNVSSEPVDRDIFGNAIINSARDAFDPPPSRNVVNWVLTIYRNEPFFNWVLASAFQDKLNLNQFVVEQPNGKIETFHPGSVKCVSILPTGRFSIDAQYVPIAYKFELREFVGYPDPATRNVGVSPFQLHLLNQGYRAWYNDAGRKKPGKIVDGDGQEVNFPVRLGRTAAPVNTEFKVTAAKAAAITLPALKGQAPGQINHRDVNLGTDEEACFVIYQNYEAADFAQLNL